jgi:creatinine amidohydrolase
VLGNALVAPVIAYVPEGAASPPTAHMRFPGTITIPEETFDRTLEYAARSFRQAGFRDIVFLGDHGSYQRYEKAVADRLDKEWVAQPVRVHAIGEYYRASETEFRLLLRGKGYGEEEIGTHAGLADTSLTLAVDPSLVRTERLQPGGRHESNDGVNGDPRRSNAELGRLGVDLIVTRTVDAIKKAIGHR